MGMSYSSRNAFLIVNLLVLPRVSFPAASPDQRSQARALYERSVRIETTLASRPEDARTKADYEKVISSFRAVYRTDPAYSKVPAALEAVGGLYEEMGRLFSDPRYFHSSIVAYKFLRQEYAKNPLARDALFAIGEIYRSDLNNPKEARAAFREFLTEYPKAEKAPEAREKLREIEQLLAGPSQASPRAGGIPEVTAVRRWVGSSYTRIVINVEDEVRFDASRLHSPDRLVFDLSNARPSASLVGKAFPVEDGFLRQIRIAQYRPNVTRVVLDIEKIEDYSAFSLPNPFRLIIDVHGPPPVGSGPQGGPPKAPTATASISKPARSEEAQEASGTETKVATRKAEGGGASETTAGAESPPVIGPGKKSARRAPSSAGQKEVASVPGGKTVPIRPATPTESGSRTLTRALGLKIGRIAIDPGHGGHDTGTVGPTGLTEKEVVLDVALRLAKLLEEKTGGEVILTRRDDTFIPLEERTAIANEKAADLFISIHTNASRERDARGIETYYLNFTSNAEALEVAARENATSQESVHELRDLLKKIALTEKVEESHEFAAKVQREIHSRLGKAGGKQRDRGVKKAPFVVLIGANMPSILSEVSFLTNPQDERLLKRGDYRQKIAEAIYQGVSGYVKNLGGVRVAGDGEAPHGSAPPSHPVETSSRGLAPHGTPNF